MPTTACDTFILRAIEKNITSVRNSRPLRNIGSRAGLKISDFVEEKVGGAADR